MHQNNNVAFKRFDMSGWLNEPSGTLSGTMWFQFVVSLKVYRSLYMMGARLSGGTNIIVNIFVNIRPIVNIVVSLD